MKKLTKEDGSVSLFVVILTALLVTIIVVGFTQNMLRDQRQASDSDLSQSARDSALAGVEDAKRALLVYRKVCLKDKDSTDCQQAKSILASNNCTMVRDIITLTPSSSQNETMVQQNTNVDLNQAYTCAKITMNTDDYKAELSPGRTKSIPLQGESKFNKVVLEWFARRDMPDSNATRYDLPTSIALGEKFSPVEAYPAGRPSVMRTSIIQLPNGSFNLSDLDNPSPTSGERSLFLIPASTMSVTSTNTLDFSSIKKREAVNNQPVSIKCSENFAASYSCRAELKLLKEVNVGEIGYFSILPFYNKSSIRVSIYQDNDLVKLYGVQPLVDSTGRANDIFRRIEARIELGDINFPRPVATVDTDGSICKDFSITDDPKDYSTSCEP